MLMGDAHRPSILVQYVSSTPENPCQRAPGVSFCLTGSDRRISSPAIEPSRCSYGRWLMSPGLTPDPQKDAQLSKAWGRSAGSLPSGQPWKPTA